MIFQVLCVNFVFGVGRRCPKILPYSTNAGERPCSQPGACMPLPTQQGAAGPLLLQVCFPSLLCPGPHSAVEFASGAQDPLSWRKAGRRRGQGTVGGPGRAPAPKASHAGSVWGHSQLRAASCLCVGRRQGQASAPRPLGVPGGPGQRPPLPSRPRPPGSPPPPPTVLLDWAGLGWTAGGTVRWSDRGPSLSTEW